MKTNAKYTQVGDFSEGLAAMELNGKYGFIDESGAEVIPLIYDEEDDIFPPMP
jgi:hypothetical protein